MLERREGRRGTAVAIGVAMLIGFAVQALQRHFDLGLHDEGFLWYGAQRLLRGELPIRDFQAYDPARYAWVAAWMGVVGDDGLMTLRWADAALAAIAVALVLLAILQEVPRARPIGLVVAGGAVSLWLIPFYKVSDSLAVALLLFGLARLIREPTLLRFAVAGGCLGIASAVGINHAFYGGVASVLALMWLRPVRVGASIAAAAGGWVIGYAPVLALDLFAPGFFAAFIDEIRQLGEAGATNLTLPLPQALAVLQAGKDGPTVAQGLETTLYAAFFLTLPLFWAAAAWITWRGRWMSGGRPTTAAGLFLSLPYAHYAWSRSDWVHVAVSILPVLAVLLAWALGIGRAMWRWTAVGAIGVASVLMTARNHPISLTHRPEETAWIEVDGDRLLVWSNVAAEVRGVEAVRSAAGERAFFAGPYLPGAYALARRRSPAWEIYMLFPSTPARQHREIGRLAAARLGAALLSDERVDFRPDLGLMHTHPLLVRNLADCLPSVSRVRDAPHLIVRRPDRGGRACGSRSQLPGTPVG